MTALDQGSTGEAGASSEATSYCLSEMLVVPSSPLHIHTAFPHNLTPSFSSFPSPPVTDRSVLLPSSSRLSLFSCPFWLHWNVTRNITSSPRTFYTSCQTSSHPSWWLATFSFPSAIPRQNVFVGSPTSQSRTISSTCLQSLGSTLRTLIQRGGRTTLATTCTREIS